LIIQSDIHDEPASKAESCEVGNRCLKENAATETPASSMSRSRVSCLSNDSENCDGFPGGRLAL
jgi:hypothetical protein